MKKKKKYKKYLMKLFLGEKKKEHSIGGLVPEPININHKTSERQTERERQREGEGAVVFRVWEARSTGSGRVGPPRVNTSHEQLC